MRQLSPDAPGLDPLHAKAAALIRTVDRTTKRLYRKPTRDVELVRTIRDAVHSLGVVERRIEVAASGIGTGRQRWLPTSIACGRRSAGAALSGSGSFAANDDLVTVIRAPRPAVFRATLLLRTALCPVAA